MLSSRHGTVVAYLALFVALGGQILHSTASGVDSVTFHAFVSGGACGRDGVGTVAG